MKTPHKIIVRIKGWRLVTFTGGSDQNPKKKKCRKAKQLSEKRREEKRREVKGKGEKERYTHLNAEFQRIAR